MKRPNTSLTRRLSVLGSMVGSQAGLGDVVAGASVALVLIPQALAYAVVAGMPAERGLQVAAVAPIAAAFLASSPYLGTGPTAITSLLTFGALSALAVPSTAEYVGLAALLALLVGGLRVLLGMIRWGVLSYLISRPVLAGFTTGAAVVIVASQIPAVLDVRPDGDNPLVAAVRALSHPDRWHLSSMALAAAVALVIGYGRRIHRFFPGVAVAVAGGVAWAATGSYDGAVIGHVSGRLPGLSLDLPWSSVSDLFAPALVIAVVGFAEPSSIARYYANLERTYWDPNRELVSQGMANLAAGVFGGFPAGGSFTRSALVREAGARTRLAGGVTGLVVLVLLPFLSVLEDLPLAVLASTVIMGVRSLLTLEPFRQYRRYTRLQFSISVITFALTLALAPHVEQAVIAGVSLAAAAHLWRELRVSVTTTRDNGTLHLSLKGVLYFASAPLLEERLGKVLSENPDVERLVVHLDGLGRIDVTGALGLREMLDQAHDAGLETAVAEIPPQSRKIIRRVFEGRHGVV